MNKQLKSIYYLFIAKSMELMVYKGQRSMVLGSYLWPIKLVNPEFQEFYDKYGIFKEEE